jgi:ketosteroid isomerase-like protein
MTRKLCLAVVVMLFAPVLFAQSARTAEDQVWSQEQAYWQYVKTGDLDAYRSLWHENFLGWPYISPEPARKAQITNWIKLHTDQGDSLQDYNLQRLVSQQTGDLVTTTYRISLTWAGKNGTGSSDHSRIIHTWIRGSDGRWRILSGMSAPLNSNGR